MTWQVKTCVTDASEETAEMDQSPFAVPLGAVPPPGEWKEG